MTCRSADVTICGAGIAGIAAAYFLTVHHGIRDVVLIDERPLLSLTSDKSTECYRNWWPGPGDAMVRFMNRSIDLLEALADETNNCFNLNRRGYLYATGRAEKSRDFVQLAAESSALGSGPVRCYTGHPDAPPYRPTAATGYEEQPTGADVILDPQMIRQQFPYLAGDTAGVIHARRCGWLSAQQLGMYLWEQARQRGARLLRTRVEAVQTMGGRIAAVQVRDGSTRDTLATRVFVNAAGPFVRDVGHMLGVDLPVFTEPHLKLAFDDYRQVVPRDAPLLIWTDPTPLVWSDEERAELAASPETQFLLEPFPSGVHARPEGGPDSRIVLVLWSYETRSMAPRFPPPVAPEYPEIALRGLARMLPGLQAYLDRVPRTFVDGGYYTKTRENRPLIGPLPVSGAYLIGALSGYGVMAACAAGELLAAHVAQGPLPPYAPAFMLERYAEPAYQQLLATWGDGGQL